MPTDTSTESTQSAQLYHRWSDGAPLRHLRDATPSVTPQEDTSSQQAIGSGDGRPAHFFSFSPILHPSPLPLTHCSTLFSYLAFETSTDRRIITSKKKLRLQPTGGYKVSDHPNNPRSNLLEWSAAPVAWELAGYKVDIAALNETLFPEQNQLEEVGAGYTIFRTGQPKIERRDVGRLCHPERHRGTTALSAGGFL
nr:unnamed protein product [Spirometra erinaceieuropaei]